jgi:hypothetical protein
MFFYYLLMHYEAAADYKAICMSFAHIVHMKNFWVLEKVLVHNYNSHKSN